MIAVRPKSKIEPAFVYRSVDDLSDLVRFVGKPATINEKMETQFKKRTVVPGMVIFVDTNHNIKTMSLSEAEALYEVVAEKEPSPKKWPVFCLIESSSRMFKNGFREHFFNWKMMIPIMTVQRALILDYVILYRYIFFMSDGSIINFNINLN